MPIAGFPVTIYYAFKQSETKGGGGTASTGWETFLDAAIRAGFAITGTWPMRTEGAGRILAKGTNALASSIVLVCRRRPPDAPLATRREFLTALRSELPKALQPLQAANIAPVDLAQAAIGPGMAIYTRYGVFFIVLIWVPPSPVQLPYSDNRPANGTAHPDRGCMGGQRAGLTTRPVRPHTAPHPFPRARPQGHEPHKYPYVHTITMGILSHDRYWSRGQRVADTISGVPERFRIYPSSEFARAA